MRWDYFARNNIRFIALEEWLEDGVDIGFSTRQGGVSQGVYDSLNLGLHVDDQNELVLENRRRYLAAFNTDLNNVVCCQQVHGNRVSWVERADKTRGAFRLNEALPECDAMITNVPEVCLLSFYADCVPVFFYDPANRAIGIAHCGWKGTMGRIATNTLAAMQREYQSSPETVRVFIGPGIGPCCFQIKSELAAKVKAEFSNLHDIITRDDKDFFSWDLQETNAQILTDAGVQPTHITICKLCTSCHTKSFYSYRKENGETGRMGALIGLKY